VRGCFVPVAIGAAFLSVRNVEDYVIQKQIDGSTYLAAITNHSDWLTTA
jgi:hypothetical protein